MSPCIKCNGPIDEHIIEAKKRIAARLYPGRDVPPPKVCSRCTWRSLRDIVEEGECASLRHSEDR